MQLTPEEYEEFGRDIIKVLQLPQNDNGRVDTSWGDKSPIGLGRVVVRILNAVKGE